MKRFVALVLVLIGLIFLSPLSVASATSATKAVSVGIALILLFGAWRLWRRPAKRAIAAETSTIEPARPAPATTRPDAWSERRPLLKAKLAFEDLKHLHGVPGLKPKQRITLILAKEGIRFVDRKDWSMGYYTVPWIAFRGVATSDTESLRGEGQLNSVRSGAVAHGSTVGSAIALETVGLLLDKSPLIVSFLLVPDDPMTSAAVFSTWLNEDIARRILSYRTELVASGGLTFRGHAELPPDHPDN